MKADWPQSTHILILRFGICKTITLINFIKLILQKKKKSGQICTIRLASLSCIISFALTYG